MFTFLRVTQTPFCTYIEEFGPWHSYEVAEFFIAKMKTEKPNPNSEYFIKQHKSMRPRDPLLTQ